MSYEMFKQPKNIAVFFFFLIRLFATIFSPGKNRTETVFLNTGFPIAEKKN